MSLTRVLARTSKISLRNCFLSSSTSPNYHYSFHSLSEFPINKASPLRNGLHSSVVFPHCGMSTFASSNKELDCEGDMDGLSREDIMKLVLEKEETIVKLQEEYKELKDTYLRSYAEMENSMERTRREAENSKKFAIQSFAKSFLDVADNLGRAATITKESFDKIDESQDTVGAMPLLKSLLDGVEMTEKQLGDVLRKAGIEKYDPSNDQFDPNRHNAVFQVPDNSKPPGTVAIVLKAGYTLHERIIRPAEVGVTVAIENGKANS